MPQVKGLNAYLEKFPGRVVHSKYYRSPAVYTDKKVIVIGNSASGYDVARDLLSTARLPVYQSRRSKGRSEGDEPPPGIEWKPVITEYEAAWRLTEYRRKNKHYMGLAYENISASGPNAGAYICCLAADKDADFASSTAPLRSTQGNCEGD